MSNYLPDGSFTFTRLPPGTPNPSSNGEYRSTGQTRGGDTFIAGGSIEYTGGNTQCGNDNRMDTGGNRQGGRG
ncbi:hypothetical protein CALVIDRAFT_568657 [Calocera viscosa TUFC12733]|uniref:Uncharacterized protein n=1 Tax=Calocera viscosa (strain TUFC12733) TaxID=1330018 RepID=A0A167GT14_CALVF|nr:hypothetical protein CALVIDRAFT_568657 [Calocera viscosa TUFC12733]